MSYINLEGCEHRRNQADVSLPVWHLYADSRDYGVCCWDGKVRLIPPELTHNGASPLQWLQCQFPPLGGWTFYDVRDLLKEKNIRIKLLKGRYTFKDHPSRKGDLVIIYCQWVFFGADNLPYSQSKFPGNFPLIDCKF